MKIFYESDIGTDVWVILTEKQDRDWKRDFPDEYQEFIDAELYDPETRELQEPAEWMYDAVEGNGPFDFYLHPSQATWGW